MKDKKHQVLSNITGTVWKIQTQVGAQVAEGDTLVILESMKMELPIEADRDGTVQEILIKEGQPVQDGQPLVVLQLS